MCCINIFKNPLSKPSKKCFVHYCVFGMSREKRILILEIIFMIVSIYTLDGLYPGSLGLYPLNSKR